MPNPFQRVSERRSFALERLDPARLKPSFLALWAKIVELDGRGWEVQSVSIQDHLIIVECYRRTSAWRAFFDR